MANYQYSADLVDDILNRAGEPTDGTSDFHSEALRLLNRAYRAVWMGGGEFVEEMNEPWLWLKKDPPGTLILLPPITTGTVAVTNNSTSITFSSAPAASVAGYHFRVDAHSDVFRIVSHTGGATAATLDSVYTGDTSAAETFRLMKLEYDLAADFLRPISPFRVQAENHTEIDGRDLFAMEYEWPLSRIEAGVPEAFAFVTESKVRFNRYGDANGKLIRTEYDYLRKPDDLTDSGAEEPLVPLQHRQILSDIALFYIYTIRGDDRVEALGVQARAGLLAMQADNRAKIQQVNRNFGRLWPRLNERPNTNQRWPRRTESGFILG